MPARSVKRGVLKVLVGVGALIRIVAPGIENQFAVGMHIDKEANIRVGIRDMFDVFCFCYGSPFFALTHGRPPHPHQNGDGACLPRRITEYREVIGFCPAVDDNHARSRTDNGRPHDESSIT